jgi:HSP20 family molecular chaperone IbpA
VQLDHPVKSEGSTAKCVDGILTLTLSKEQNHRGSLIPVQ